MRVDASWISGLALCGWVALSGVTMGCDEGASVGEPEGGSSSSGGASTDTVFAPLSFENLGNGVWAVNGELALSMSMGMNDVRLKLENAQADSIDGLLYYTLAEFAVAQGLDVYQDVLNTVQVGAAGLEARLNQRDMGGICGKLIVTATATCNGYAQYPDGSMGTLQIYGRGSVNVPCTALSVLPAPQVVVDADLAMDGLSWIGDVRMSSPDHYSAELDTSSAFDDGGGVWGTSSLTPAKAEAVDILFDGKHLLTPYGAMQAGFHARFFKDLANETVFVELDGTGRPMGEPVHSLVPTAGLTFAVLGTGKTPVRVEVRDEEFNGAIAVQLKINR